MGQSRVIHLVRSSYSCMSIIKEYCFLNRYLFKILETVSLEVILSGSWFRLFFPFFALLCPNQPLKGIQPQPALVTACVLHMSTWLHAAVLTWLLSKAWWLELSHLQSLPSGNQHCCYTNVVVAEAAAEPMGLAVGLGSDNRKIRTLLFIFVNSNQCGSPNQFFMYTVMSWD